MNFCFTADYLRIVRKVHRLTLAEMADVLGLSTSYVHAIEIRREPLTDNVRRKIIETFELTSKKLQRIERDYNNYTFRRK